MKKAFAILLTSVCVSVTASANSYQWVPLNGLQMQKFEDTCGALRLERKVYGTLGSVGLAGAATYLTALVAGAAISTTLGEQSIANLPFFIAGFGGALSAVVFSPSEWELISNGLSLFSVPEQEQLVIEQQTGAHGLMTEKLYQLAEDYGFSADKALALLNLAAADGAICQDGKTSNGERAWAKTDLKDMDGVKIIEVRATMKQDPNRPTSYDQKTQQEKIIEQIK